MTIPKSVFWSPFENCVFWKKKKNKPQLIFNFRWGLLSSLFIQKPLLVPQNCNFTSKTPKKVKGWYFGGFRGKIAVLSHLEGILEKVKKVDPL